MQAGGPITSVTSDERDQLRTLGGRLKWARKKRQLSQAALAALAGVSQGTVGNIEAGIRDKPRELLSLAAALKVSPAWLETGKGDWEESAKTQPKAGSVFEEMTEDEILLLKNFRAMLDDDQKHFSEEIASRAAKMRAYTAKVLEQVGIKAKPAKPRPVESKPKDRETTK